MMAWGSVSEFLGMGGYGPYVWISFGVTAACMIGEYAWILQRHAAASRGERAW